MTGPIMQREFMHAPINRFPFGPFLGALVALLAIALIGGAVVAQPQTNAPQTAEPTYEHLLFAPLIVKALPPTATPTPTPTPVPINVSGTYRVVNSNLVENCDGDYQVPPPQDVTVVQNDINLTMTFLSGTASGTIEPSTGVFQVGQTIDPTPGLCPYGCNRATTGTFRLTEIPLTFRAHTVFEILTQSGTVYCTYEFDQDGTRQ